MPPALLEHLTHAVDRQTAEVAERIVVILARNRPNDEVYLATLRRDGFVLSDEAAPTPCDAPVCFLGGHRDGVLGFANLVDALGGYRHASHSIRASAGHYLPLEQPAAFAAVTQSWLAQCEEFLDAGSDRARARLRPDGWRLRTRRPSGVTRRSVGG